MVINVSAAVLPEPSGLISAHGQKIPFCLTALVGQNCGIAVMCASQEKNILIFIPNTLELVGTGYLEGFSCSHDNHEAYYVTSEEVLKKYVTGKVVGCFGGDERLFKEQKYVKIDPTTCEISFVPLNLSVVTIRYDFKAFRSSQVFFSNGFNYGCHFQTLGQHLVEKMIENRCDNTASTKGLLGIILTFIISYLGFFLKVFDKHRSVTEYSATLTHFHESLFTFRWFLSEMRDKRIITPILGNFLITRLVDIAIGLFLLNLCLVDGRLILNFMADTREVIIDNLKTLLTYLMGSPIGLKLNNAFNNCLGTFFFYYISLWRVFLYALQPVVEKSFVFLVLPGAFGFSYQIALISDVIAIVTFHVYCTYVYAASLIYFQLRSLLALWRLFLGRKYNPLRERVDSHQYGQRQLFLGTLGLTVLLFLLPTTTLYYTVFTVFRLAIIAIHAALTRLRHFFMCLPFYVMILWILKSPSVAGTLQFEWNHNGNENVNLEVNLKPLTLSASFKRFTLNHPAPPLRSVPATITVCKIMTGVLV